MAAQRAMSKTQERVVRLISQPKPKRSPVEINLILPYLKKKSDILFALADNILKDIILNCDYLKTQKDEVVIRQGDQGDCLYLLLKGFVTVYINDKNPGDEQSDGPNKKGPVKKITPKNWLAVANEIVGDIHGQAKTNKKLDRKLFGKKIVTFGSGKAFGEIALLSEDNVRTASVIADEECDLLIIRRHLYNSTLKSYHEKDFQERREFIDNNPLFMTWSDKHKKQLERGLIKECFSPDMPIIKQGEDIKGLLFIRAGMAKVLVEPDRHISQYPHMVPFPTENDVLELEHIRPAKPQQKSAPKSADSEDRSRTGSPCKSHVSFEHVHIKRTQGYAAAEKRVLHRSVILCTVREGAMFGDVEMMHNLKTYSQSVTSLTYTEIYYITHRNVERLIQKRHPNTVKILTNIVVWKMCNRATSVQGSIVPFVQHLVFKMTEEKKPQPRVLPSLSHFSKHLPEREAMFQNIIQEYLKDKAELIEPMVAGGIYYKTIMRKKAKQRAVVRRKKDEVKKEILEKEMRAKMSEYSNHLQKTVATTWLQSDDSEDEGDNKGEKPSQVRSPKHKSISSPLLPPHPTLDQSPPANKAFMTEVDISSTSTSQTIAINSDVEVEKSQKKERSHNYKYPPIPPPVPKKSHTVCLVYDEDLGSSIIKHYGAINNFSVDNTLSQGGVNNQVEDNVNDSNDWISKSPSDGRMVGAPKHMISTTNDYSNKNDETDLFNQLKVHSNTAPPNYELEGNEFTTQQIPIRRNTLPLINDTGMLINTNTVIEGKTYLSDTENEDENHNTVYSKREQRARTAITKLHDKDSVVPFPNVNSTGFKQMSITASEC